MDEGSTAQVQGWLARLRDGDPVARDALIRCAVDRLGHLTRKMLRQYPGVGRWEQTDDVLQNAAMRLHRALGAVSPETPRDFYRLAATQIRRELIDLARHHNGPHGQGRHHESWAASGGPSDRPANSTDPGLLSEWTDFHAQVESLGDDLREIFDLIFYQGLSRAEAADLIGVSDRTVKRRWQEARLALFDRLGGHVPGF